MTVKEYFDRATAAETWGGRVFWIVVALSVAALVVPEPWVQRIVNPLLIAACATSVVLSVLILIWQNGGNHLLRATQLTNAFNVPIGDAARSDYYNNNFPPSVDRLAATTFENSLFTARVLDAMLTKERVLVAGYLLLFIVLTTCRWSSINLLLFLAQIIFSVDVLFHWFRMERFLYRVCRVKREFQQLFVQGGIAGSPSGLAIVLAAFSDYECAKDEAAMPLDGKVFSKINPKVTKEWDALRASLKIP